MIRGLRWRNASDLGLGKRASSACKLSLADTDLFQDWLGTREISHQKPNLVCRSCEAPHVRISSWPPSHPRPSASQGPACKQPAAASRTTSSCQGFVSASCKTSADKSAHHLRVLTTSLDGCKPCGTNPRSVLQHLQHGGASASNSSGRSN